MNRPRKHDRRHWPDYLNGRKKAGGIYYSWKHPETGKEFGLGYEFADAARQAREANLSLLAGKTSKATLADRIAGSSGGTMSDWLDIFKDKLAKRESKKKGGVARAASTMKIDARMIEVFRKHFAGSMIEKITTKECDSLLQKYRSAGHDRQAVNVRSYLVDCFNEAESAGWIPRGTNPAEITKANAPRTKRNRLSLEQFNTLLSKADGWARTAMLLALVTGQRVSDIAAMKYSDARDGFLFVQQIKTGERIKIPLQLELAGHTLKDIIKQSRVVVGAKTIVHKNTRIGGNRPGDPIGPKGISRVFSELVADNLPGVKTGTPPTFHEIRALSKALHTERGIDTLALLGHESAATAKIYTDPREGWVEVKIPTAA